MIHTQNAILIIKRTLLVCTVSLLVSGCVLQQFLAEARVPFGITLSPADYGLPDTILGYRIISVHTVETMACIPENGVRLTLQVDANNSDDIPQTDVNAVLEEIRRYNPDPDIRWQLGLTQGGSNTSPEEAAAALADWNTAMADGCVIFGMSSTGFIEILATASP